MKLEERRIPSSDGKHELYCRVFFPEGEPKGLFHVVHGMTEYIARYDGFMQTMAENGFVCYGYDNLGHGHTAKDESELGYIGGRQYLVRDAQNVSRLFKIEFGEALPCVLLGHSMGSFIARCAANPDIWDKIIVMGTGGPNPSSDMGLALLRLMIMKKGERGYAPAIEKMIFGSYNTRFKEENDEHSWLSNNKERRERYKADKYCSFHFTVSAYYDLVKLQSLCNSKTWYKKVSDKISFLLVSGSDDPVGDYGMGVSKVYELLKNNGKDVQMKLYPGCRHEILNDFSKDEVTEDILNFAKQSSSE